MPYKTAEQKKEYHRKWYLENQQRVLDLNRKNKKKHREEIKAFKATLKCIRCGESHPSTLDFHHRNPDEKDCDINRLVAMGVSLDTVKKEIEKCDVLCANCHRKEHWKE